MLYIPRGIIHQAKATKDFSTHLTVSTYQAQNWGDMLHTVYYTFFTTQYLLHTLSTHQAQSWGDMLDVAIPAALSRAMDQSVDFRRGLPLGVFDQLGAASGGVETDAHEEEEKAAERLMQQQNEEEHWRGGGEAGEDRRRLVVVTTRTNTLHKVSFFIFFRGARARAHSHSLSTSLSHTHTTHCTCRNRTRSKPKSRDSRRNFF